MRRIVLLLCLLAVLAGCGENAAYSAAGLENYRPDEIVSAFGGDLDSSLAVFPSYETAARGSASYEAIFRRGLFDTDGRIVLECAYGTEDIADEIERLRTLSMTISYGDQEVTNEVRYDGESYSYPAYITIDGFGSTYEYALVITERRTIVYLYLSYPSAATINAFPDYMKKDRSVYDERSSNDCYSMYNHSFDGGKSWVEFDD